MNIIVEKLGAFGPWIICSIIAVQLLNQFPYFISFLFFYVMNTMLNDWLKTTIREPRPVELSDETYGMPSYHAQMVFYGICFFYQVKRSVFWTLLLLFIAGVTLYQRWKDKYHSVEQLMVGSVIGSLVAVAGFQMTKLVIQGEYREK
jgi:hypothetical protein